MKYKKSLTHLFYLSIYIHKFCKIKFKTQPDIPPKSREKYLRLFTNDQYLKIIVVNTSVKHV